MSSIINPYVSTHVGDQTWTQIGRPGWNKQSQEN